MTPKCETCKADLKKIAACKICWERKGTELAELQKTDIEKFWTKIPLNWREKFDHFEVDLVILFSSDFK